MSLNDIFKFEPIVKQSNNPEQPIASAVSTNQATPPVSTIPVQVSNQTQSPQKSYKKIPITFIILPIVIVLLFVFTVVMSIKQGESKPTATPSETVEVYATPKNTTAPNESSKTGVVKKVVKGSVTEYFITTTSGQATILVKDESYTGDFNSYLNKKVIVSGVFASNINTLYVRSIIEYDKEGNIIEPTETPLVYPNKSASPTPSSIPISSPIGE